MNRPCRVKQGLHQHQVYSYYSFLFNCTKAVKKEHAIYMYCCTYYSLIEAISSIPIQEFWLSFILQKFNKIHFFLCYLQATTLQNILQHVCQCTSLCVYSFKLRMGIINSCCILRMPIHGVLLVGFTIS